jgi:uncharacterized protein
MNKLTNSAIEAPKKYIWTIVILCMTMIGLVLAPTLSTRISQYLHPLTIDADPENMLESDEAVRVFHKAQKEKFSLYDLIVVGVRNKSHKNGVFNVSSLKNIHDLVNFSKGIQWENEDGKKEGVISIDLITPTTVDNIEQAGIGTVKFEWLMADPPTTDREALAIMEKARNLPLLDGTLLSDDGQSIALYIPITSKSISYKITQMLEERMATYEGEDEFFTSGLPVAQDTFAVEMFKQMATTTPAAMILIFGLLWFFFRNITLIISPMIVANIAVIMTVTLLTITGNNIHIMSSMIPIFVMPIAVLDAIHILSEFYDRYPEFKDRKKTLKHVMSQLSKPMLYTSLTTAVGFFSLNLTPLPPIQVFGTFVGIGVILAWLLTITIIPAYIMLMPERKFANFGIDKRGITKAKGLSMTRFLTSLGGSIPRFSKTIVAAVLVILAISIYGITKIVANDNPVNWFGKEHKMRIADKALNEMFGGTYMAYLSIKSAEIPKSYQADVAYIKNQMESSELVPLRTLSASILPLSKDLSSKNNLITSLSEVAEEKMYAAPEEDLEDWDKTLTYLDDLKGEDEIFKNPQVLNYIGGLQDYLKESGYVGKSSSIVEIVKTVHRELYSGDEKQYRIPDNPAAVAQTLITFEGSHRPQDLWHFITPDYKEANVWLQLKSGDNQDMSKVESLVDTYFAENPPPKQLKPEWFGLTHINVTWQDKIVGGMVDALAGSFVIVLIMMIVLFRSVLWGLLAMVPLTFSIAVLYGFVGLIGKDYDAPIAILSALMLGLAVDYAIHFIARSRQLREKYSSWRETSQAVFDEPARAITRNVIVIGVGFLPLVFASLVPYQTTGIFISSILVFAGVATLIILPALIHLLQKRLFKNDIPKNVVEIGIAEPELN